MITLREIFLVLGMAAAPVIERGALPLALHVFNLPPFLAYILVVVGNILPAILILWLFDPIMNWLGRYIPPLHRFSHRVLAHFRAKVHPWVDRYGLLGLLLVVAIPTPLTGVYTGAGGAAVLGMDRYKAFLGVLVGVCVAQAFILFADLGVLQAIHWFKEN